MSDPTAPGVIPLRPLTLGEIVEGTITTMRRHAAVVFGCSAAVGVASALLMLAADLWILDARAPQPLPNLAAPPDQQLQQMLSTVGDDLAVAGVVGLLAQAVLSGFLTVVVGRAAIGRPIGFGEVWQELRPRLLPLFGLTVIVTVLVTLGLAAFFLPGIWAFVLLSLSTPALVLERGGIGAALRRAVELVRGSWWRVFGVLVLAVVTTYVVSALIQTPFVTGVATAGRTVGDLAMTQLGSAIAHTIVGPFAALVTAFLYIDQRMRREKLGEELSRAASNR
jgi:hypothetical protein